ncbi:hypothetical protein [Psychrobacter sp. van23A]|uniref:hypothetical protein n=1 Tax=Psychrobacter sp. van23A TaxID=3064892 RepID=UPI0027BA5C4C|nr:hypothetical protein [Psychrobacter sp. van23A]WLW65228.1 hypothetical protein RAH45_07075 [Psychrobacter sp. van23A]
MKTKDGSNQQNDAGKPTYKRKFEYGFTSMDNRLFYLQEVLKPNEFSIFIRIYRATEGYDGRPKAMSGTYFQKLCNMSKNTVTSAIKGLEELELIFIKKRSKAVSFYLVNLKKMDDMYQEIKQNIESEFEGMTDKDDLCFPKYGNHDDKNDDIDNCDSQNMTKCFPEYDQVNPKIRPSESHILGSNKEKLKEKNKEKIESDVENKKPAVKSQTKKPAVKKETYNAIDYPIPFFIEQEDWIGFVEMRADKKKPLSERACKMLVNKLTKWHEQGLDINQAIQASIINSWQDVYEPKPTNLPTVTNNQQGYNNGQQQSASQPTSDAQSYMDSLRRNIPAATAIRDVN